MVKCEYAFNDNQEIIFVDDASEKESYYCPLCSDSMFAKNKGVIRRHHYAHKNVENCTAGTGESMIHLNTKGAIYSYLLSCLKSGNKIEYPIKCPYKGKQYEEIKYPLNWWSLNNRNPIYPRIKTKLFFNYNILQNVTKIYTEKQYQDYKPDVSLWNDDKLVFAFEVIHTHKDPYEKWQFYRDNNIPVCYIFVDSIDKYHSYVENKLYTKEFFHQQYTNLYVNDNPCNLGCGVTPILFTKNKIINHSKMVSQKLHCGNIEITPKVLMNSKFQKKLKIINHDYSTIENEFKKLKSNYQGLLDDCNNTIRINRELMKPVVIGNLNLIPLKLLQNENELKEINEQYVKIAEEMSSLLSDSTDFLIDCKSTVHSFQIGKYISDIEEIRNQYSKFENQYNSLSEECEILFRDCIKTYTAFQICDNCAFQECPDRQNGETCGYFAWEIPNEVHVGMDCCWVCKHYYKKSYYGKENGQCVYRRCALDRTTPNFKCKFFEKRTNSNF